MFKVKIYIETSLRRPGTAPGQYAAIVEYINSKGEPVTRQIEGSEEETTFNRSVLMATVRALKILEKPCEVTIFTDCTFFVNTAESERPEKWKRAEWKKSSGEGVKNKELWQEFLLEKEKHKIDVALCKNHEYKHFLQAKIKQKQEKKKGNSKKSA